MSSRKWLQLVSACLGAWCALMGTAAHAGTEVHGVRLWQAPDHTRLVFDLSARTTHHVSTISAPERLVIDFSDSRLAGSLQTVDLAGTPIERIRSGMYTATDLRVVLDLLGPVEPKSFLLPPSGEYGNRLVVDVFAAKPPAAPDAPAPAAGSRAASGKETLPAPVPKAPLPRDVLIAIDAGHGGEDPGAIGPRRVREKDVVLAIARALEKRVNAQPGYRATMVRTGDYYIPLGKRREIARKTGADLFLSVHADAFRDSRARGSSVYALSQRGATSTSAAFLAERENGADLIGGVNLGEKDGVLASVLTDLSMTATMDASLGAGKRVLHAMGRVARLHKRDVEQAGFVVLKSPDMPSILVETGFISNPGEAERLGTRSYQTSLANAIFEGLGNYFQSAPPPDTLIALKARESARPAEYVIARGDTLSGIAERYRVSVADIVRTNGLGDSSGIRAGQRIVIPQS